MRQLTALLVALAVAAVSAHAQEKPVHWYFSISGGISWLF